jgi:imidazolonepropionase
MIAVMAELLLVNARLATMAGARYALLENGGLLAREGRIEWVGPMARLGSRGRDNGKAEVIDARGALVTPGLVDAHTHLVHAGNRAREFEMRLQGASYEEIARSGGGIASTVRATRLASDEELLAQSSRRLEALMAEGVTTVEIKSGYGLDLPTEARCLRVARRLADGRPVRITTTFLGAHALPPEFAGRPDDYVSAVCDEMIPAIAAEGLADAVDAFCESIAFSPAQVRRVFAAARAHGLRVKLHADQLSNGGGAALAAEHGALSADHLEHTDAAGVAAMAKAGTVAVLLPAAFYFLRETQLPPIELFRRHAVPLAVATDCNPGTSPTASLLTTLNMACTLFRLSPEEALAGATANAARALGRQDIGTLEAGKSADLAVWDAHEPAEIAWQIAGARPTAVVFQGRLRGA